MGMAPILFNDAFEAFLVLEKKILSDFTIYGHGSRLVKTVEPFEQIELIRQNAKDEIWWKLVRLFQRRRPHHRSSFEQTW